MLESNISSLKRTKIANFRNHTFTNYQDIYYSHRYNHARNFITKLLTDKLTRYFRNTEMKDSKTSTCGPI